MTSFIGLSLLACVIINYRIGSKGNGFYQTTLGRIVRKIPGLEKVIAHAQENKISDIGVSKGPMNPRPSNSLGCKQNDIGTISGAGTKSKESIGDSQSNTNSLHPS